MRRDILRQSVLGTANIGLIAVAEHYAPWLSFSLLHRCGAEAHGIRIDDAARPVGLEAVIAVVNQTREL